MLWVDDSRIYEAVNFEFEVRQWNSTNIPDNIFSFDVRSFVTR